MSNDDSTGRFDAIVDDARNDDAPVDSHLENTPSSSTVVAREPKNPPPVMLEFLSVHDSVEIMGMGVSSALAFVNFKKTNLRRDFRDNNDAHQARLCATLAAKLYTTLTGNTIEPVEPLKLRSGVVQNMTGTFRVTSDVHALTEETRATSLVVRSWGTVRLEESDVVAACYVHGLHVAKKMPPDGVVDVLIVRYATNEELFDYSNPFHLCKPVGKNVELYRIQLHSYAATTVMQRVSLFIDAALRPSGFEPFREKCKRSADLRLLEQNTSRRAAFEFLGAANGQIFTSARHFSKVVHACILKIFTNDTTSDNEMDDDAVNDATPLQGVCVAHEMRDRKRRSAQPVQPMHVDISMF